MVYYPRIPEDCLFIRHCQDSLGEGRLQQTHIHKQDSLGEGRLQQKHIHKQDSLGEGRLQHSHS